MSCDYYLNNPCDPIDQPSIHNARPPTLNYNNNNTAASHYHNHLSHHNDYNCNNGNPDHSCPSLEGFDQLIHKEYDEEESSGSIDQIHLSLSRPLTPFTALPLSELDHSNNQDPFSNSIISAPSQSQALGGIIHSLNPPGDNNIHNHNNKNNNNNHNENHNNDPNNRLISHQNIAIPYSNTAGFAHLNNHTDKNIDLRNNIIMNNTNNNNINKNNNNNNKSLNNINKSGKPRGRKRKIMDEGLNAGVMTSNGPLSVADDLLNRRESRIIADRNRRAKMSNSINSLRDLLKIGSEIDSTSVLDKSVETLTRLLQVQEQNYHVPVDKNNHSDITKVLLSSGLRETLDDSNIFINSSNLTINQNENEKNRYISALKVNLILAYSEWIHSHISRFDGFLFNDVIMFRLSNGIIVDCNLVFSRVTGFNRESIRGSNPMKAPLHRVIAAVPSVDYMLKAIKLQGKDETYPSLSHSMKNQVLTEYNHSLINNSSITTNTKSLSVGSSNQLLDIDPQSPTGLILSRVNNAQLIGSGHSYHTNDIHELNTALSSFNDRSDIFVRLKNLNVYQPPVPFNCPLPLPQHSLVTLKPDAFFHEVAHFTQKSPDGVFAVPILARVSTAFGTTCELLTNVVSLSYTDFVVFSFPEGRRIVN